MKLGASIFGVVPGAYQRPRPPLDNGIGLYDWSYFEHRLPNVGTGNLSPGTFSTYPQGYGGVAVQKSFRSLNNGRPMNVRNSKPAMEIGLVPFSYDLQPLIVGQK